MSNLKVQLHRAINFATEIPRGLRDWAALSLVERVDILKTIVPHGDGRPIISYQGLYGFDWVNGVLVEFLQEIDYSVHKPGIKWNSGTNLKLLEQASRQFDHVHELSNGRKIGLIGHSHGGILAMLMGYIKKRDKIHNITTAGSPIGAAVDGGGINPLVNLAYKLTSKDHETLQPVLAEHIQEGPPENIPFTSIMTGNDGVVYPKASRVPWKEGETETVRLLGLDSHLGLIANPLAFIVIADRLSQPEGLWKPFDPSNYPLAGLFIREGQATSPHLQNMFNHFING